MTEQEFKDQLTGLMGKRNIKLWLTRSSGHRLDFLWSLGEPQEAPSETLDRQGIYYIVGQSVPGELKPKIVGLFRAFCQSEDARKGAQTIRPLRFIRTGR